MSNAFLEKAQKIMDSGYKLPINVLVWGPGKGDRKGYAKRKKIKDEIKKRFPNSEVYFSEDQELRSITQSLGEPLIEELIHAKAADLIIVLDLKTARGTKVEIGYFSRIADVAKKLWVLLPEEFNPLSGLAAEELQGIKVEFFSDSEFNDCTLATNKCIKKVFDSAFAVDAIK